MDPQTLSSVAPPLEQTAPSSALPNAKIETTDGSLPPAEPAQQPVLDSTAPRENPPSGDIQHPEGSEKAPIASERDNVNANASNTLSGSPPRPLSNSANLVFPVLSPILMPVSDTYVEPPELRPLSEDKDKVDLPTVEHMLAATRPDHEPKKSSEKTFEAPAREFKNPPVKSEDASDITVQGTPDGPQSNISAPASRPRARTPPPTRVYIDISDSSLLLAPTARKSSTPSLPSSATSASQARPKRKHTPSLPPASITASPLSKRSKTLSTRPAFKHNMHWVLDGNVVIQI
ncbi:hypothetical protein B0H10DRAFT_643432 [Mycena sp. CBHHK59/15]|nr:hypothetical protein B0H10DRAFT_643432 [Mycena sp. CBHHK59/15]